MTVKEERLDKHFRTNIARGLKRGKDAVDRNNNLIEGFSVMTKGFVKDFRGWEIDDRALEQIVEAGNNTKLGVKVRFGHPNMSSTALGTFLGRAKNFRKEGRIARADLHFSDTAFNTPNGDLANYVMDLAENDPDMFGASVVLSEASLEYRLNKDGTRQKDEEGNDLPPLLRVKRISGTDVVDDPAANSGFFAKQFFSDSTILSAEMTEFLDKFLEDPEAVENVINFLSRYQRNRDEVSETTDNGEVTMESNVKEITLDQLKKERPDLVEGLKTEFASKALNDKTITEPDLESVKNEGLTLGQKQERERVVEILRFSRTEDFKEYGDLSFNSIEQGFSVSDTKEKMMSQRLKDLKEGSPKSPGPNEETQPKRSHLDRAKEYQKEHNCSMTEALRETAESKEAVAV